MKYVCSPIFQNILFRTITSQNKTEDVTTSYNYMIFLWFCIIYFLLFFRHTTTSKNGGVQVRPVFLWIFELPPEVLLNYILRYTPRNNFIICSNNFVDWFGGIDIVQIFMAIYVHTMEFLLLVRNNILGVGFNMADVYNSNNIWIGKFWLFLCIFLFNI